MSVPTGSRRVPPQRGLVGPQLHVVVDAQEVAVLTSTRAGQAKLTYLPAAGSVTRGLSCCLKVTTTRHSGPPVVSWISGLLPDRSEVLARWRSQLGLKRQDAYALLWHVGEDVAGAARFVRPDRLGDVDGGAAEPVPDETIGERIRALAADAAGWVPSPGTGQFSLAGAQAKFALARTGDGHWAETSGSRPTTHILKPAIPGMVDQDINEHLTMRLAAAVGLTVAHTDLMEFAGARCLVVTRFDRYRGPDGTWRRIHQEDAVQALGLSPLLKYEQNGGPGVRAIARLLRENVTGEHDDEDVAAFIDAIAFNWLVAGTDAHARNYSLLHTRSSTRLAPLYDLNSFLPYATDGRPFGMAMNVGYTERDPARVTARDWDELARDCGVDSGATLARVSALAENILAAVDDVAADPSLRRWDSPLPARLAELLAAHVAACQRRL
jgi:serine/threonine-protein kinase HipA